MDARALQHPPTSSRAHPVPSTSQSHCLAHILLDPCLALSNTLQPLYPIIFNALSPPTSHGPINATISLSTSSNTGALTSFFTSRVNTFSTLINLSIAPKGLPLRLLAGNNGAPTNLTLDSSFESEFDLQTKLAPESANGPSLIPYVLQSYERITGRIGSLPSSSTSRTPA